MAGVAVDGEDMEAVCLNYEGHEVISTTKGAKDTKNSFYFVFFESSWFKTTLRELRGRVPGCIIPDDMMVLALDTTTGAASCALSRDGVVLREDAFDPSRQLALQLPDALEAVLALAGAELREVDAFAVATGPGSFTGLRIGIATMQGLAFAAEKPLIGISALTALSAVASPAFLGSRIATWIDAWRGDVYAAMYEDGRVAAEPVVANPANLLDALAPCKDAYGDQGPAVLAANDILFIGDGAATYREMILTRLGNAARIAEPTSPPLSGIIAMLATIQYRNGHLPPPHAIRPLYVRRSDAELARQRNAEFRTTNAGGSCEP
jgi:tRNA threonylcarbamoyladenosine biosynthesis protein TsaB